MCRIGSSPLSGWRFRVAKGKVLRVVQTKDGADCRNQNAVQGCEKAVGDQKHGRHEHRVLSRKVYQPWGKYDLSTRATATVKRITS